MEKWRAILGHTGYCYYENSPRGEARDVCKTGRFSGDRLEGEVTYTTLNQEGETSTWKLEVKDGTVQLDDRWDLYRGAWGVSAYVPGG